MGTERSHRDLAAWQEAMNLVEIVYHETVGFPKEEIFGLTAQTRRAVISVPSNIAEGAARNSSRELAQYLDIAIGSLAELETQLELAVRLGYLAKTSAGPRQVHRVGKLICALRESVKSRIGQG